MSQSQLDKIEDTLDDLRDEISLDEIERIRI